jgi:hypothetical protein
MQYLANACLIFQVVFSLAFAIPSSHWLFIKIFHKSQLNKQTL